MGELEGQIYIYVARAPSSRQMRFHSAVCLVVLAIRVGGGIHLFRMGYVQPRPDGLVALAGAFVDCLLHRGTRSWNRILGGMQRLGGAPRPALPMRKSVGSSASPRAAQIRARGSAGGCGLVRSQSFSSVRN